jgi:hypothetical protein
MKLYAWFPTYLSAIEMQASSEIRTAAAETTDTHCRNKSGSTQAVEAYKPVWYAYGLKEVESSQELKHTRK